MLPHYLGTLVLYHSDLVGRQDSHSGSIENHTADQNLQNNESTSLRISVVETLLYNTQNSRLQTLVVVDLLLYVAPPPPHCLKGFCVVFVFVCITLCPY